MFVDGACEYIYRMQNTVDHTDVEKLAELLGAKYVAPGPKAKNQEVCEGAGENGKTQA